MIYAAINSAGVEIAWGASPSLALRSACASTGMRLDTLIRAGYYAAPSKIIPTPGGLLERQAAAALRERTPEQRHADLIHNLRWRTGPLIVTALVAVAIAAWALLTGIPSHR